MLRKVIFFAVHQPLFVLLLLALFIGTGVFSFRTLPIEAFPDVTDIQVTVVTLYPGHAAEEVEKQVTIPLEIALSGLPHSVRVFSHTQYGLSSTYVTFDDEADNYFARQQVLERLQTVDLPAGLRPELAPLSSPIGEIYRVYLKSDKYDAMELRSIEDWVVERNLKLVPGVADVVSRGGYIKQFQVMPDLTKMRALGVNLRQLFEALERGNMNAGGGYIEQGEQQFIIRGVGLLRSIDDIRKVVVAERAGVPVLVEDVAEVGVGHQQRQGIVGMDAKDDIVNGTILMRKGENPSDVLEGVKAKIEELNTSILPKGVRLEPYYDRAWLIDNTLKTVFKNLAEGAFLVSLVLFLFLGRIRPAAIVAVIIPLSLLATFIGLKLIGIPANLLSLGAMDFGIIVDGAVIVVENIFRRVSHHEGFHGSFKELVAEAASEVGRPTFFSMLIIILAHLPIFALQRHEGRIFAPMAYTITSALIGSLLFSLTLVPVMCVYFMRRDQPERESFVVRVAHKLYRTTLRGALRHPRTVLLGAALALAATLALAPMIGSEFLPELNEGSIWVNFTLPPGVSPGEVNRALHQARTSLLGIPEVARVVSQAGRPDDGTDPKPINMVEILVELKPLTEWRPHVVKEELIAQMETMLDEMPGVRPTFSQPIRDSVLESISQIDGQIVIKIFGDDSTVLKQEIQKVLEVITPIRGVGRAFVDRAGYIPQLQVEIDRERAARYGLNVADIQDVIETALGGRPATQIWEGEKRYGVVVRLREEQRNDTDSLRSLLLDTAGQTQIPLDQVATISVQEGAMNISRENGRSAAAIGVFIKGRDMGSLVKEMQEAVDRQIKLPAGYNIVWGGEFENQQRAMSRLIMIVPISIVLIFVLLFEAFKTVKSAALILLNVPFALVGGILALYLTGINLSVSAAIGFIALFGQAVLNGVVMVSYFNQLQQEGAAPFAAVFEGAQTRLRTVLMTSLLAMLGLLPMALSHGIGSEVQRPLAVVIIGGLVSATILTLIVLPAVYLMFHAGPDKEEL
ncbi:MAG: CusA/CzcA family heavy metal efflux RND transporter [Acidobacteria bacterium]|nr:CusA/CzcA family heavy metal efflux RND transporter [Acidobacteriota bacterium]